MGRAEDEALFSAAGSGDADGVARAIAAGANLDWPNPNRVSDITEEEHGPPHRLCGRVPRIGRSVVGRASSSGASARVEIQLFGRRGCVVADRGAFAERSRRDSGTRASS